MELYEMEWKFEKIEQNRRVRCVSELARSMDSNAVSSDGAGGTKSMFR